MCTEVLVNGCHCEGIGDLRSALGREPIMCPERMEQEMLDACGPVTDDECLCHVDHDATAAAMGMAVNRDDCFLWAYEVSASRLRDTQKGEQ